MTNPYTLVFGQPPLELVERTAQAERIISEFSQERPANCVNLVTGIRGSGKTVFITQIAKKLGCGKDWIVIDLNAQRDLLTGLAAKLDSRPDCHHLFRDAEINLQFFGIGVGVKNSPPIMDIEEGLLRMLRIIKKHGKRILVTIDEVTNSKNIRIFTSAFQIFLREELPVYLLLTGLYRHIDSLRNSPGMTFLERAPRTVLSPLNYAEMVKKYVETLRLREDEASRLAAVTRGYSFAFQVIGYFTWENPGQREKAMDEARDYLYEFAYRKIWSELSRKDRELVCGIAEVPSGEVLEIRRVMQYSSNQFNPYRDRLIKAGVLEAVDTGIVRFALPWFDEFAEQMSARG